jgi:gluconate 2-dehydrogenase
LVVASLEHGAAMNKPRLLVGRPTYPEHLSRLREYFEVTDNQDDRTWTTETWTTALSQHEAACVWELNPSTKRCLAACPKLRICANLSVGYNNFDVPAMTRHKVLATNAPDVLNDTTADFGFALMMAAARRVTESEIFIRNGEWSHWRYDQFAGAEIHHSTLGIIGMGRVGQGIAKRGALGFGMKIIYHNRSRLDAVTEAECKATYVSKQELLPTSRPCGVGGALLQRGRTTP